MTSPPAGAHDRPDPVELLDAVREFLDAEPDPERERLHRRVASNVVATVQRELRAGAADDADHARRLEELGVSDNAGLAALAAELGESDPRFEALRRTLAAWAQAKVRIVNPRYLEDR